VTGRRVGRVNRPCCAEVATLYLSPVIWYCFHCICLSIHGPKCFLDLRFWFRVIGFGRFCFLSKFRVYVLNHRDNRKLPVNQRGSVAGAVAHVCLRLRLTTTLSCGRRVCEWPLSLCSVSQYLPVASALAEAGTVCAPPTICQLNCCLSSSRLLIVVITSFPCHRACHLPDQCHHSWPSRCLGCLLLRDLNHLSKKVIITSSP
jgi:hypothetical protein